jgi:hypothetical protein
VIWVDRSCFSSVAVTFLFTESSESSLPLRPHCFKRCFYNSLPLFGDCNRAFFRSAPPQPPTNNNVRRGPSPLTPFNNLCPNMHQRSCHTRRTNVDRPNMGLVGLSVEFNPTKFTWNIFGCSNRNRFCAWTVHRRQRLRRGLYLRRGTSVQRRFWRELLPFGNYTRHHIGSSFVSI